MTLLIYLLLFLLAADQFRRLPYAQQFGSDMRSLADDACRQALALAPNQATISTASRPVILS